MNFDIRTIPHFDKRVKKLAKKYKSIKKDISRLMDDTGLAP